MAMLPKYMILKDYIGLMQIKAVIAHFKKVR